MPRYVIHIGPPKAGSKYLQTSMAGLSESLEKIGVYYPTNAFSLDHQVWHAPLYEKLVAGPSAELEDTFNRLNATEYRYVVFSFEGLFGLTDQQLEYLKKLLGNSPIQIVYYCRRLSERIPSLWKQDVKEGRDQTFPEVYGRAVSNLYTAPDLNNSLVWNKFSRVFGRDTLSLISFNNLVENKVDLVDHFLKVILGVTDSLAAVLPENINMNKSPDRFHIEILRALNAIHILQTGASSDLVRRRYLSRDRHDDAEGLISLMRNDLGKVGLDDRRDMFGVVYQQLKIYADRLVNPGPDAEFFSQKPTNFEFVRSSYLLNPSVAKTLNDLYNDVMVAQSNVAVEAGNV